MGRGRGVGEHLPVHDGEGVSVGVVVSVGEAVAVAVGLGATVGVYSITQTRTEKTWSGDVWSGMHAFFRFQVTQPVP